MTQPVTMEQLQQLLTQMNTQLGEQIVRSNEATDAKISGLADIIHASNQETNTNIRELGTMLTGQIQDLGVRVDNVTHQVAELVSVLRPQEREEQYLPPRDPEEARHPSSRTTERNIQTESSESVQTVIYVGSEEGKKSSSS
jgi:hypothetical protein